MAAASALVTVLFLSAATSAAWGYPPPGGVEHGSGEAAATALASDDQCAEGDGQCALNALQRRSELAVDVEEDDTASTAKCCRCKSGTVGWSVHGKCLMCKTSIVQTINAPKGCKAKSPRPLGAKKCASLCGQLVGTKEKCCKCGNGVGGWSPHGKCLMCKGTLVATRSVPSTCVAKAKGFQSAKVCGTMCSRAFTSKSKCCKCSSGTIGWSPHGKCLMCKGKIAAQSNVASVCQSGSKVFLGAQKCANRCGSALATKEKCCKCKNGYTSWSATGTCRFCKGKILKKTTVPSQCVAGKKGFLGSKKCSTACKTKVKMTALLQDATDVQLLDSERREDGVGGAAEQEEAVEEETLEEEALQTNGGDSMVLSAEPGEDVLAAEEEDDEEPQQPAEES